MLLGHFFYNRNKAWTFGDINMKFDTNKFNVKFIESAFHGKRQLAVKNNRFMKLTHFFSIEVEHLVDFVRMQFFISRRNYREKLPTNQLLRTFF